MTRKSARPKTLIPNLFGAYGRMPLLLAMAQNGGFIRRSDVIKKTGSQSIDNLRVTDKAGVILLPWHYRRGRYVLALNPKFPLHKELIALLRSLGREHISPLADVVPRDDRLLPKRSSQRAIALDYLFGSPVRTQTLATLEALGGRAQQAKLHRCVPEQFTYAVKTVVGYYVSQGVLEKRGTSIAFCKHAWMPALQSLLRAYLSVQIEFAKALKAEFKLNPPPGRGYRRLGLLGPPGIQRALIFLAVHGPSRPSRLLSAARVATVAGSLRSLEREGIIAIRHAPRTNY
jgi:hypothetical protein